MLQQEDNDYSMLKTTIPTWIMHSKEQLPLHQIFIKQRITEALQKLSAVPLHPPLEFPENTSEVHDIHLQEESTSIWLDLTELNKAAEKGTALITGDGKQVAKGR